MEIADDQGKAENQVLEEICSIVSNSTKNLQSIKKEERCKSLLRIWVKVKVKNQGSQIRTLVTDQI